MKFDLALTGALVVDPLSGVCEKACVGISDGKIALVAPELDPADAQTVIDLTGLVLQPGIIDTHLHLGGEPRAHRMVALAGVTTCIDMCGPLEGILSDAAQGGSGLNIAVLDAILPGKNVSGTNPEATEIRNFIDRTLEAGALGVKLLGGHYPMTPQASARMVEEAASAGVYMAWHCGTTEKGSNLEGLIETVELCAGHPLHLPHLNAYCRGAVKNPIEECLKAAELLESHPEFVTESYLSARNGCPMQTDETGTPISHIVTSNLKRRGFSPDRRGMYAAIRAGVLSVIMPQGDVLGLAIGDKAIAYHESVHGQCYGSFDGVNPFISGAFFATARRNDGTFLVDGIGTDGGAIPRNVILEAGLCYVRASALTRLEYAVKTSLLPARMLGLDQKGHLSIGADADLTVYDPMTQKAQFSFVAGKPILYQGRSIGQKGRIICTQAGEKAVRNLGLEPIVVTGGIACIDRKNYRSNPVPLAQKK